MQVAYRRGQLGDVVLLGSVADGLSIATSPRYASIARRFRGVQSVIEAAQWKPGWVDLQGTWRSLGRARIHKQGLRRRAWLHLGTSPRPTVPTLYARALGTTARPPPWIDLPTKDRDTLVLFPGASTAIKRPRLALLRALEARWKGPVCWLGSPDERVEGPGVFEQGFEGTFEVLARAAVAVGGDTGLLHLAGACGVRLVALFGPTHPDDGFWVYPGTVVQRDMACRPCTLHRRPTCPLAHHRCMDHDLETVWRAVCAG